MSVARLVVDTRHVIGTGGVTSTDRVRLDQGTSPYSSAANCSAHQGAARPGSLRATFAGDWQSEGGTTSLYKYMKRFPWIGRGTKHGAHKEFVLTL